MKFETGIIIAKGATAFLIGFCTPLSASLAQYINSSTPIPISAWLGVILPAAIIGGASALNAFLSSSFSNYRQAQKENGGTNHIIKP